MSNTLSKTDDVSVELAVVLDEYSAVDCYRYKKNAPIETPSSKKALSYNAILKSDFPGMPYTDAKYKVPDSVDMDYIDMLAGKDIYMTDSDTTKVPIRMESFEKLCYYPELTESQKQALIARKEQESSSDDEISNLRKTESDWRLCSPCLPFLGSGPPSENDKESHEISENSENNSEKDTDLPDVLTRLSDAKLLSDISEESNVGSDAPPPSSPVEDAEVEALYSEESNEKQDTSREKRKKSLLHRMFSRKVKDKNKKNFS